MNEAVIEVKDIAPQLEPDERGIWFPRDRSPVSYPENGHAENIGLEEDSFWFEHRRNCIVEVVRLFPPGGVLLDVGGGDGHVSLGLQEAGIDTILVEPGPDGVRCAHARGVRPIICSTLDDAGFKARCIPAIGAFDLIEHVENNIGFLEEVRTLLAPGGRLYLTAPAYNVLFSNDDRRAGHYRRYTRSGLAKLLEAAGFQVEYGTYIFALLPAPIFLFRTLPSKLGGRRDLHLQRTRKEHRAAWGPMHRLLHATLDWELNKIRAGKSLPFGGTCLIVASAAGD